MGNDHAGDARVEDKINTKHKEYATDYYLNDDVQKGTEDSSTDQK